MTINHKPFPAAMLPLAADTIRLIIKSVVIIQKELRRDKFLNFAAVQKFIAAQFLLYYYN